MHFYPGLTLEGANALEGDEAEGLWLAITQIEAQKLLLDLRVADYPYMKERGRGRTHSQFHKLAYPRVKENNDALSMAEFADKLRTVINGE